MFSLWSRLLLAGSLLLASCLLLAVVVVGSDKVLGERCDTRRVGTWGVWCEVKSACDGPQSTQSNRCKAGQAPSAPRVVCCRQSGPEPPADVTILPATTTRRTRWTFGRRTTTPKTNTQPTTTATTTKPTTTAKTTKPTGTATPLLFTPAQALEVAKKKCVEYRKYVTARVEAQALLAEPEIIYEDRCQMVGQKLIAGGVLADSGEFPHMVALGYQREDSDDDVVKWSCGGSLISPRFVLTAAHCLFSRELGKVRWAQMGSTELSDPDAQRINIIEAIKYPTYSGQSHYDDIALLRLESVPEISPEVRPACVGFKVYAENIAAGTFGDAFDVTGWGLNGTGSDGTENLMKVDLYQVPVEKCDEIFKFLTGFRKLKTGVHRDSMLCIGNKDVGKDSCQGDSGGPAQTRLNGTETYCMYDIAGVTSFGESTCGGDVYKASIYTRVHHYLPWIASVVWPEEAT